MNPFLLEMLRNYIEFRKQVGVEFEQHVQWSNKDLANRLGWRRITRPRINGLAKQCGSLGIIFEDNSHYGFNFHLHELRLVANYKKLAMNYGESNVKKI